MFDATVRKKAIAHPVDSRLLEIARHKFASAAKRAGGYTHAKQFRRLRKVVTRRRTMLGIVMREGQRKSKAADFAPENHEAASDLMVRLERTERVRTQQRHGKNELCPQHAVKVECIGKGMARKPHEFGVKSAVVVSHKHGVMLCAHIFPGNPYDGHILSAVPERASNPLLDHAVKHMADRVRSGPQWGGRPQPRQGDHSPQQAHDPESAARRLAAQAPGGRAGDRALEVGPPDEPLLAAGRARRCVAFDQPCGGLQPALAAARDHPSVPRAGTFATASKGAVASVAPASFTARSCPDARSWPKIASHVKPFVSHRGSSRQLLP